MYWNRPQLVPFNAGSGGGAGSQPQPPPPNPLVLNRQNNTAGLWNGGNITLTPSGLTNPTATWRSPTFDLRPDLPFLSQGNAESTPVYRSKTGDWGSLWLLVDGLDQNFGGGFGFTGLKVTYQERVSPIDPTLVRNVNDPIDITGEFAVNSTLPASERQQGALLQFKPTNDVDPVRYWQVVLRFEWSVTFTNPVQLRIQASYY